MEIDPSSKTGAVYKAADRPPLVRPAKGPVDQAVFNRSEALDRAFSQVPEVRPERVAHARDLIGQVNYPPRETIAKISQLLALTIKPPAD
jgi:hypothetical protein